MWSPRTFVRSFCFAVGVSVAVLPLVGCSFVPLYGDASITALDLTYAEPAGRLEQIVNRELIKRLGSSASPGAALVTVSTSSSSRRVGRTGDDSPATTSEMVVTASVSVTRPDPLDPTVVNTLYSVSRQAAASYTTNGQRLADQQSSQNAEEQAARAVADTLSLLLAANLPGKL